MSKSLLHIGKIIEIISKAFTLRVKAKISKSILMLNKQETKWPQLHEFECLGTFVRPFELKF